MVVVVGGVVGGKVGSVGIGCGVVVLVGVVGWSVFRRLLLIMIITFCSPQPSLRRRLMLVGELII